MSIAEVTAKKHVQLTALSILLVLLSGVNPFIGIILLFLSVAPQLTLLIRKKYMLSALSWVSVFVILFITRGWVFSANYVFVFGGYSFVFYYFVKNKDKPINTVVNAAIAWCFFVLIWVGFNYFAVKTNLLEEAIKFTKIQNAIGIGMFYDFGWQFNQIDIMNDAIIGKFDFFYKKRC